MKAYLTLLDLAGYVALLLWGVHMVQTGIQRAFGPRLRTTLGVALGNRFYGLLAGMGVTAILQSSTATGLMVAGFAGSGLVGLVPALGAMLGANIGTTLIVQILSFDISPLAPILVLLGVMMFRRSNASQTRDLGRVFIGLGLILLSLHLLLSLVAPYGQREGVAALLQALAGQPGLAVLIAAVLAWAAHSSVAVVVLVMSFAAHGTVSPETAFALVLGANLGTAVNPVIEGSARNDPVARRLPLGNLLTRVIGVLVVTSSLTLVQPWITDLAGSSSRAVANFHTLFNIVLALVFLPLLGPFARLLERWLPATPDPSDAGQIRYLDRAALEVPVVALGHAAREALRMADTLQNMLQVTRELFVKMDRKQLDSARQMDDVLDRLNSAIKIYLAELAQEELTVNDRRRAAEILTFITNLEQAGDVVDKNLLVHANKLLKRGLSFSPEGQRELADMLKRLDANLQLATSLFVTDDSRAARLLSDQTDVFRQLEARATQSHFERLQAGRIDSSETSGLHLDMLRDLRRINSHLVACATYPMLADAPGRPRDATHDEPATRLGTDSAK